jgi:hypothetical protein
VRLLQLCFDNKLKGNAAQHACLSAATIHLREHLVSLPRDVRRRIGRSQFTVLSKGMLGNQHLSPSIVQKRHVLAVDVTVNGDAREHELIRFQRLADAGDNRVGVILRFSDLNISIKTVSCSEPETIDVQSSRTAPSLAQLLSDQVVSNFTCISRRDSSEHC